LNTKQFSVIIVALTAIGIIFFLGNTKYPQKTIIKKQQESITVASLLQEADKELSVQQKEHLNHLNEDFVAAKNDTSKLQAYEALIKFWGADARVDELAVHFVAEKAKLENSEKNLTFAADLILSNCIEDNSNMFKKGFKATIAKELYEKAIAKNPTNDSLKIGLGGSIMFGAKTEDPMAGTVIVLDIVKKDSTNAYAHKMLGYGGLLTGQTEKALDRFIKSYTYNKNDIGLVPYIALLSKKLGKTELAETWFKKAKEVLAAEPNLLKQFEQEFQSSSK
jgi:tetratricopeptide (TPR) repeat protein